MDVGKFDQKKAREELNMKCTHCRDTGIAPGTTPVEGVPCPECVGNKQINQPELKSNQEAIDTSIEVIQAAEDHFIAPNPKAKKQKVNEEQKN